MNISEHLLFEKDLFKLRDEYKRLMEQDIRGLTNEYVLSADIRVYQDLWYSVGTEMKGTNREATL